MRLAVAPLSPRGVVRLLVALAWAITTAPNQIFWKADKPLTSRESPVPSGADRRLLAAGCAACVHAKVMMMMIVVQAKAASSISFCHSSVMKESNIGSKRGERAKRVYPLLTGVAVEDEAERAIRIMMDAFL